MSEITVHVGEEIKGQWVRVADVFVIGPLMVLGGVFMARKAGTAGKIAGVSLAAFGVATVWFNGRNYLRIAKKLRETSELRDVRRLLAQEPAP